MAEGAGRIDLNVDLAEGAPWDEELISLASTANICLGAHAGSPELARRTAQRAFVAGVRICLHPGYADREGMGRVSRPEEAPNALLDHLLDQARVLEGYQARAVKPHGALYHDSSRLEGHAAALTAFLAAVGLPLIGSAAGLHPRCAEAAGVDFIPEAFADRGRRELLEPLLHQPGVRRGARHVAVARLPHGVAGSTRSARGGRRRDLL